jgi:glycosyltransferase involved in cell wall biosynthesis
VGPNGWWGKGLKTPRVSIVIPAYNEGDKVVPGLRAINNLVTTENEILVVVDSEIDTTVTSVRQLSREIPSLKLMINTYGPGPANAIRFGIHSAKAATVVVSMADGCDDASQIDELTRLVERGVVIASASRYMPGGQQVGGPRLKRTLSKLAGKTFAFLTGVGTRDVTNSFKAYNRDFVESVKIHSTDGFEIGIELVAKARRLNEPVAEIPTTWIDRSFGMSNFQLKKWLPSYIKWYLFGLGFEIVNNEAAKIIRTIRSKS